MFDIRSVADTELLEASRHLAGGASHAPVSGRMVTRQTVYNEIRRRQLSIDPPPGPAIDTDPRGPFRWDLEVDENDSYLCPMPNGGTAGRCRAELVVEGIGWEYLGTDCEMARPLTDVAVESWTVRCTEGHVLEVGPNDGNGAPAFRLDRFLTGEGHTVDDETDAPVHLDPVEALRDGTLVCQGKRLPDGWQAYCYDKPGGWRWTASCPRDAVYRHVRRTPDHELDGTAGGHDDTDGISTAPPDDLDELIAWADLGIIYKADPRDMALTIKKLATALRDSATTDPAEGCVDCEPDNPAHDGDEYRCPRCRPAFEEHARAMGAREGCDVPDCPHEVTHQHEPDGSLPAWLVEQMFEETRREVES